MIPGLNRAMIAPAVDVPCQMETTTILPNGSMVAQHSIRARRQGIVVPDVFKPRSPLAGGRQKGFALGTFDGKHRLPPIQALTPELVPIRLSQAVSLFFFKSSIYNAVRGRSPRLGYKRVN